MLKTIALCLTICFSSSFILPPHTEFLKMSKTERESLIKETWNQRYQIIETLNKSENSKNTIQTKAKTDFFEFFNQMLILDRDLERQTSSKKK